MHSRKTRAALAVAAAAGIIAGCAQVPPNAGENPADPWESMNRQTHEFNTRVDKYVYKPVAKGYRAVTPDGVEKCVSNMMDNLAEPKFALNNALQGKGGDAVVSVVRFLFNSTFGLFGCFDMAGMGGLKARPEDFGQTLGYWGVGNGPYFVIPFIGPSTVRDAAGLAVGYATSIQTWIDDPGWLGWTIWGVALLDARARLLDLDEVIDTAVDPYAQMRDGYLQMRRSLVYDGAPPGDEVFMEDPEDEPASAASK